MLYNKTIMGSTQLSIRTDEKTKKAITDFAASLGLSTSTFATVVLLQAVREQRLVLTPTLEPTPYLEKIMREADEDLKTGKNLSPVFDSVDDMLEHLKKTA
jgi:addiction module RelB/DinJ family antitoxin